MSYKVIEHRGGVPAIAAITRISIIGGRQTGHSTGLSARLEEGGLQIDEGRRSICQPGHDDFTLPSSVGLIYAQVERKRSS
jgi:hypothetical protein